MKVASSLWAPTIRSGSPLTEKDQSVTLKPFWIDAYALSNARFAAFAEATGHVTDAERYG